MAGPASQAQKKSLTARSHRIMIEDKGDLVRKQAKWVR